MKYALPILLSGLLAASPVLGSPFDGRWAQEPEWCANTHDSGTDQVPVEISGNTMRYYEAECEIATIEPVGTWGAAWRAHLVCKGEGETFESDTVFGIAGGFPFQPPRFLAQIDLTEGFVSVLHACPQ